MQRLAALVFVQTIWLPWIDGKDHPDCNLAMADAIETAGSSKQRVRLRVWVTYRLARHYGLTDKQIADLPTILVHAPNGISWQAYEG